MNAEGGIIKTGKIPEYMKPGFWEEQRKKKEAADTKCKHPGRPDGEHAAKTWGEGCVWKCSECRVEFLLTREGGTGGDTFPWVYNTFCGYMFGRGKYE